MALNRTSPALSRAFGAKDRDKAEQELAMSVKKAVSLDETAPKQKHVRVCTLFTWDWKTAAPFWNAMKLQPVLSDEIQCFKALITIHKVMRDGHSCALKATMAEVPFLDTLARSSQYASHRGYVQLISSYVSLLKAKLQFHTIHPDFSPNLDYEEYRALRKVDDPNEGYNAILELMSLQDSIDTLTKSVFQNLRPSSNNECRIAVLVPLVEESFSIYKFITSMMKAMHARVESHDVMAPLRERYKSQYTRLAKFYFECSNLKYLTSLISIPRLQPLPPDFTDGQVASSPPTPREKTPPPEDIWGSNLSITPEPNFNGAVVPFESSSHEQMLVQQQMVLHNNSVENELNQLRQQNAYAQQLVAGYEGRIREMEHQMHEYEGRIGQYEHRLMSQNNFDAEREYRDKQKDDFIQSLQEQVAMWKTKYENIAKMYAQLRKEHLDLLQRYKVAQSHATEAKEVTAKREEIAQLMSAKTLQISQLTEEKTKWRDDAEKLQIESNAQIAALKRDLSESRARFEELTNSKGAETQNIVAQFTAERADQEARMAQQASENSALMGQIVELKSQLERVSSDQAAKEAELHTLQTGMSQSLAAMRELTSKSANAEAELMGKIDYLHLEHRSQMDKIMDSVLDDCKAKVSDSLFELDSSAHAGSQTATPEFVLSLLEKLMITSNDFSTSFTRHITGESSEGDQRSNEADAIRYANNLAQAIYTVLHNSKGVTRLVGDEAAVENLLSLARSVATSGKTFFHSMQSGAISALEGEARPARVRQCNAELHSAVAPLVKVAESLVKSDAASKNNADTDLGDFVERQMASAAKAIEEAGAMLMKLLAEDRSRDPKVTPVDLQVHQSLLSSAKAITDAMSRLIICATHSQQEIVANGRGTGTTTAFYKKNNRWMDGLISAAKAVAAATRTLVESADGVVHGTQRMEQLIVAANEVAAATAQLVAASRVKAIRGSKTQEKLEAAARAVTDATKLLVKAAEQVRSQTQQSTAANAIDLSQLSIHDFKKSEMEQQVKILTLGKQLEDARKHLADMRRHAYHKESV